MDSTELEKKKLRTEIDEIVQRKIHDKIRVELEKKNAKWMLPKEILKICLTFITIGAGIFALWSNTSNFLDQREKSRSITMSKEIIKLVTALRVGPTDEAKEDAATLLSYYGKDAVPLLLKNFKRVTDPRPTIDSLRLIKENKSVRPNEVIDPLMNSAERIFEREKIEDKEIKVINNYIIALGTLGMEEKKKTISLLSTLQKKIKKKEVECSPEAKLIANKSITKALENLGS